jgi:hypothetical protein
VPSQSSRNLTALATDESAESPRPNGDLLCPELFEEINWLKMLANFRIEIVVLPLALFSIWVLYQ